MSYLLNPYILGEPLPVTDVYARYVADSFSGTTWSDISGNGRNATVTRGTVSKVSATGNGVSKTFNVLQGGTGDGIQFPSDVLPSNFTLFHVTRYNDSTGGRIFDGIVGNWLNGFWGDRSGVAHHDGWLTQNYESQHYTKWVLSTSQDGLYRSNMAQRSTSVGGNTSRRISINAGVYASSEPSPWQCAEVIVYGRELSASEIVQVEEYLDKKYGFGIVDDALPIPSVGLMTYLDASNSNSYPGTGNTWYDLSKNQRNFTWSSASWTNSGNLDYFSTSSRRASGPASNTMEMVMATGYTVIYVGSTDSLTSNSAFKFYGPGSGSTSRAIFAHPSWTNGTFYYDQAGCCDGATQRLTASMSGHTGLRMWTVRRTLGSVRSIWRGNSKVSQVSGASNISFVSTSVAINPGDSGYNWVGKIGAFIVYNRGIEDSEISSIYSYFNNRGLTN